MSNRFKFYITIILLIYASVMSTLALHFVLETKRINNKVDELRLDLNAQAFNMGALVDEL